MKLLIGLLLGVLALSGCAGIPQSSQVYFGEQIAEDESTQFIRVIARPPNVGMTPEEIVRGFLEACADPSENYGIARQYLSVESAIDWNPSTGIEVYEASTVEVLNNSEDLTVGARKLGTISDLGRYQTGDPSAQISKSFEVQKDLSGEWRIANLSDGILLSSGDVDRSFRSFPIYFFNTELTSLITDNVMIPVSNSGAATSLVRSLLDGPSPYLSPVATSAFPVGTSLTYGSVPVTNGVAQVDLSNEVLGTDEATRRALTAQLVWTLSTLANVSGVQISVSGQPLTLNDSVSLQTIQDWQELSTSPNPDLTILNVIRSEKIYSVQGDTEVQEFVSPSPLVFATPNLSGLQIAAVTTDRKSLLVSNASNSTLELIAKGDQISKPTWDLAGHIYFSNFGEGVQEILPDGSSRKVIVDVSNLGTDDQVKHIAVANDGARVAVVLSNGIQDVVAVGAIFKTDTETRIIGLHRIERSVTYVRDITWSSSTSIAVLGSDESKSELIFDISLFDGKSKLSSAPIGAQQVTVDGAGKLYVSAIAGSDQLLYQQSFGSWIEIGAGVGGYFSK